jgi:WD40 repeat protein
MNNRIRPVSFLILIGLMFVGSAYSAQSDVPILNRPPQTVLDVEYSPDGNYLARVFAEGRLEVFEVVSNRIIIEDSAVLPHSLLRAKIDWSPKSDLLAAGIGSQVYIWNVMDGQLLETIKVGGEESLIYTESGYAVPQGFHSVEWDSTGNLLRAHSTSSRHIVWSIEQQAFISDVEVGNAIFPMVWLADNQRVSNGEYGWDIVRNEVSRTKPSNNAYEVASRCSAYYGAISTTADRDLIAKGTFNGCIVIMDANTGDQIAGYKIGDDENTIWGLSWSPDDSAIVAVDSQGGVQVVDVATGSVTRIAEVEGALYAVDWADTDSSIAYGGQTTDGATVFAEVDVAEVRRLMGSDAAREPEFAVTLER